MDAFFELESVLRSKKAQLTLGEVNVMRAAEDRARRDFYFGVGSGSIVTWLATQRLNHLFRSTLAFGAGVTCGIWLTLRSLESSVEHLLSLEGSRIQRELAYVMLKRHHGDPWVHQSLSKHFFAEKVFDDSSGNQPTLRWRYRNFSGDNITHSESTPDNEETDSNEKIVKKTAAEPKQVYATAADDAAENPFDLIFGVAESAEDVSQPDTSTTSSRRQMRGEKRSRRRHRRHHHDEPDI